MQGAAEPEAAHRSRAADDSQDQRILATDAVASPAGQDAAGAIDAVIDGQQHGGETGTVAQHRAELGQEGERDEVAASLEEGGDSGEEEGWFARDGAVEVGEAAGGEAGRGDGQRDGQRDDEVEEAEEAQGPADGEPGDQGANEGRQHQPADAGAREHEAHC